MTGRSPSPVLLEAGWMLEGTDGAGMPVRLVFGETELQSAYLGITLGRHPALVERLIADPTVSARHCRLGLADGRPFIEDLNSLNGTVLEDALVPPFQPVPLEEGDTVILGKVQLQLRRQAG
jgi:hypothetical protein